MARRGQREQEEGEDAILGRRASRRQSSTSKGRRYDKVLESGLEQRFSTVARHYEITVEKAGANATAVRFSHRRQDNAGACTPATGISRPSLYD